jgi:hypothetical protein
MKFHKIKTKIGRISEAYDGLIKEIEKKIKRYFFDEFVRISNRLKKNIL